VRRWPRSLSARLFAASALLLPLSLGGTGWYLERAHSLALHAAQAERLQLQVLALLAQAEVMAEGALEMPLQPLEARFGQPNSGLYAAVQDARGALLWASPSALSLDLVEALSGLPLLEPGERHVAPWQDLQRLSWQVLWQTDAGSELPLRFTVLESLAPLRAEVAQYRRSLLLWLGGTLLLLLATQLLILFWGLRPLRALAATIARIEAGESQSLAGPWPREVRALTANLQRLLDAEQARRERMRNTLGDLAHSLKTPLAVLRSSAPQSPDYPAVVAEQLQRMETVVAWQLQRAVGGEGRLLQRVSLRSVLDRLCAGLRKVYAGRALDIAVGCAPEVVFRGDERDLFEVLGNVLDNACKHARQQVRVGAAAEAEGGLAVVVEDDGTGVPEALRSAVLERGVRADSRPLSAAPATEQGQGLGLALACDIVRSYGGQLRIDQAPALGGARVIITLP
jgi:two-component system sensor histidine kinase PhoQ